MRLIDNVLLWRKRFNHGYGITSILKYAIAFFGLASQNVTATMKWAVAYGFLCFIVGYVYMRWFMARDMEIDNLINPFTREVREKLK